MGKLFKSGKALSPLVAAIILIMVAVAASVVVAAWIGGLTLTSVATEQVALSDVVWGADNANVSVTFENTGTADLSIKEFKIAGVDPKSISPTLDTPYLLKRGSSVTFLVSKVGGFNHKVHYMFMVTTSKGKSFGPYYRTAP
jgi:flagellin-like protein